jgi:hypothetical protein
LFFDCHSQLSCSTFWRLRLCQISSCLHHIGHIVRTMKNHTLAKVLLCHHNEDKVATLFVLLFAYLPRYRLLIVWKIV